MPDLSGLLVYLPLAAFTVALIGLVVQRQRNRILRDELRAVRAQLAEQVPRPDVSILSIAAQGGSPLVFQVEVVNRGSKQTQATLQASIAGRVVYVSPRVDLLVNAPPARVLAEVPRPEFGDLVQALGHATTLYGETLTLTATTTDGEVVTATWSEEAYDPETDRARYEAQQRAWRIGRGKDTEADRRAEYVDERIRRQDERP